jgi:hypothetical protein
MSFADLFSALDRAIKGLVQGIYQIVGELYHHPWSNTELGIIIVCVVVFVVVGSLYFKQLGE